MVRKRCRVICRLSIGPPCVIPMKSSRYTSTCARAVAYACGDRASQLVLASSIAVVSSSEVCGGLASAKSSRWCGGAVWCMARVSSVLSLTVSVVAQKNAADSTHPMGIDRWNPTSCSSSGVAFGTRNATNGISPRRTQMRMYASARSTLSRKAGANLGGAARMQSITLYSAFLKRIASLWATWVTASLRPRQEKSYMRQGFLPSCGMDARGDIQSQGRWRTVLMGKRAIWPARACSSSSVLTKVFSFVA